MKRQHVITMWVPADNEQPRLGSIVDKKRSKMTKEQMLQDALFKINSDKRNSN